MWTGGGSLQIPETGSSSDILWEKYISYALGGLCLTGIFITSYFNYLIFHTVAELFSIVIAFSIFVIVWNTRKIADNNFLLFLGIAYLFVAVIDLTHTMAYKGMNIFADSSGNLSAQLWIGGRYMQSLSLAIAPVFLTRCFSVSRTVIIYTILSILVVTSIFSWQFFPDCFIHGSGLTPFKIYSEYVICIILLYSIINLYRKRDYFDKDIHPLIVASILMTIVSELAFTFYVNVYGISNLIGHIFKITASYLMYRAIIVGLLTKPYEVLFREVIQNQKAKEQAAMERIKLLEGFLPICASCKNIRNDKGAWSKIENYLTDHADIRFTHGICPDCSKKLYPDVFPEEG